MDKTKEEINLLSELLDINKFDYGRSVSNFMSLMMMFFVIFSILISLSIFIKSYQLKLMPILIGVIFILLFILRFKRIYYKGEIETNRIRTHVRREMIEERYEKLGVDMNQLKEEFNQKVKKIKPSLNLHF